MTKQNVLVESDTAQALAGHASLQGKTLYALMDEILQAVARVYQVGGSAEEIYSSWNATRMSKQIGGAPLLPRNLVLRMAERIYRTDRKWLSQECFEAGRFVGEQLRLFYPAVEDLEGEVATIPPFFAEQRLEVKRVRDSDERLGKVRVQAAVDPGAQLTECAEQLIAGLLSAYSFRITESQASEGTLVVLAVYDPTAAESNPPSSGESGETHAADSP